jgi:sugar lactone lactonase YvrE
VRRRLHTSALAAALAAMSVTAVSAANLQGRVLGGGAPIAGSTVTLWAASAGAPRQVGQAKTGADGRFALVTAAVPDKETMLYLVAIGGRAASDRTGGDNPAIALMTVLGAKPPSQVTINEMTTLSSVITHNQYLDGTVIKGSPLALRIAAGNVPNFVDLTSGDFGATISDALNSAQTPTMANFGTVANALAGCVTRVKPDACSRLFAAAKGPSGSAPTDTLAAAEAIVRTPAFEPERLFALLDQFYPYPAGHQVVRPTPYLPYLTFAPSAWVFPLKFTGGGLSGPGKLMIDSRGNAWAADNFTVGMQNIDKIWSGGLSKIAPDGKPLSPALRGFTGGGIGGPGFGLTLDADDNVWVTSFQAQTISKFDNTGKPLSPPEGWNFNGQLGQMQGIIVTPSGDVWALDTLKGQVVRFPKGDPSKGELFCQNKTGNPLKNPCHLVAPFALAIDQKDNIWVTNIIGEHVTRFPASDPTRAETFKTGVSGSGLAVDSLGNVWITNKLGSFEHGKLKLAEILLAAKVNFDSDPDAQNRVGKVLVGTMAAQKPGKDGGSITVLKPDGSEASISPIYGKGLYGPWAVSIDGNDNVWISNLASASAGIVHLCGFRTEHCPPGMKTGDAISPPGGYVGGGLQMQVDVAIGPAGDVWVTNNWQFWPAALEKVDEALSTLGGGQGVVVFYGMAKPVKVPMVGPVRAP